MANIDQAVQFVLLQEDSTLSGKITTLLGDSGGATRFGIASKFHPELVAKGYFTPAVSHDEALNIAKMTYASQYAVKLELARVRSQDVANRLLSFAVNEGVVESVKIAQRALNTLGNHITVDGQFGTATLLAVNASMPDDLENAMRLEQREFYQNLVAEKPAMEPLLKGLLNRADA